MLPGFEIFEGVGSTVQEALEAAHRQIPPQPHRDFAVSRVLDWGMQMGGFVNEKLFYVRIVEDADAQFKTKS